MWFSPASPSPPTSSSPTWRTTGTTPPSSVSTIPRFFKKVEKIPILALILFQAPLDDNVFFPSVTICSLNQIRFAHITVSWHSTFLARMTFLKAIGIFTDQRKKSLLLRNFYTGNETMSLEDNNMSKQLVETELVQKEFCKYMKHTGTHRVYIHTFLYRYIVTQVHNV